MRKIDFILSGKKKKLIQELEEIYGIDKLDYVLLETGKEKIRGFSGTMSKDEINKLSEIARIEIIGLYLFREENGGLRLGLDGVHMLKDKINKNVIEISESEIENWMKGQDLDVKEEGKGIFIVKSGDDFFGSGILKDGKLINFVPKERRIRRS